LLEVIDRAAKDGRTELDLSGKGIKSLPPQLGKLTNLTRLDLRNNGLSSLPAEIGKLRNLEILHLLRNYLVALPLEIGQLGKLNELYLGDPDWGRMTSDEGNRLTEIPAAIGELGSLRVLCISCNRLKRIPDEIGKLTRLVKLDLKGNQLGEMSSSIGQLVNLGKLNLWSNNLRLLPRGIGNLAKLKRLSISNNPLEEFPRIDQLRRLEELCLGSTGLREIPAAIFELTGLRELLLWENSLKELPADIKRLKNLRSLGLHGNQISSLPPEIGQLTNLTELRLNNNQLTSVPKELSQLTNLKVLSLSDNQLTSLPPQLGELANLTGLDLSRNRLTSVPPELGELANLTGLYFYGDPLESPPPEVVKQGTKAILAYLRELAKGKKKRFEAKLLILGDGSEGKTCVSRALRGLKFKKQIRTEGVEVVQWAFENPSFAGDKENEITLNIWDFEGQEINHQSHQFFLTEKSLYLLVINGRRQFKMERAEYWLDTIRARAPESRVILVASECENTTPSWPLDKLKANYEDLLEGENWYFAVGCEDRKGVDNLVNEIKKAAANMKVMGMEWPDSYQRAEEVIRKRSEGNAQVSRAELYKIFEKSDISEESYESVTEQMVNLGLITQFRDSPELGDFIVLNPQWLTKAISLVMEDKQLEEDKGEITHSRMRQIWDKEYQGMYPTFHNCMKEFELCYDMEDMLGCLVPLRFGDARPEIPWSDIPGAKERRVEYKLNIRPPMGIMSRFIVKTHYMIAKTDEMPKGVYWHNGVFLRTGKDEYRSEALCEFDTDERALRIQVRAAFPQNMIEQLHGIAKAVFGFFEGLEPERRYGCLKFEENRELECSGNHSERRIFSALVKDRIIDCEYEWHDVDPKQLVYGFSSFGKFIVSSEELKEVVKEGVKQIASDIMSLLVEADKISRQVEGIRNQGEKLPAEIGQQVELKLRDYLGLFDEMLDNRDFNSAPAVVSITPVDKSKFNPANWFEKEYVLRPYCEDIDGVHPVDFSKRFKIPPVWWQKVAPKLVTAIKVLSAGLKIGFAGLPLAVDANIHEAMKNEVEFMKELAEHLELEGGAESDITSKAGEMVEDLKGKGTFRDLRKFSREDEKQFVRIQFAILLEEIAPSNYKARQWGPLGRVRMPDNTYRWLCAKHAKEYK